MNIVIHLVFSQIPVTISLSSSYEATEKYYWQKLIVFIL